MTWALTIVESMLTAIALLPLRLTTLYDISSYYYILICTRAMNMRMQLHTSKWLRTPPKGGNDELVAASIGASYAQALHPHSTLPNLLKQYVAPCHRLPQPATLHTFIVRKVLRKLGLGFPYFAGPGGLPLPECAALLEAKKLTAEGALEQMLQHLEPPTLGAATSNWAELGDRAAPRLGAARAPRSGICQIRQHGCLLGPGAMAHATRGEGGAAKACGRAGVYWHDAQGALYEVPWPRRVAYLGSGCSQLSR